MRKNKAFAMPYAVVFILIITVMCSAVLTFATATTKSADKYSDFLAARNYLDKIGAAAINKYENGGSTDYSAFDENVYKFVITDDENGAVKVTRGGTVALYIKFTKNAEDKYELSQYVYSPGVKSAEVGEGG